MLMKNNKNNHYIGIADVVAALIAASGMKQDPPNLIHMIAGLSVVVLTILLAIRVFELRKDKIALWLLLYIVASVLITIGGMVANTA